MLLSCLALLATLTSSVKIECIYDTLSWADYNFGFFYLSVYRCFRVQISVENPASVTDISGKHMTGKKDADVNGLSIDGDYSSNIRSLTTIPEGIEKFFTNLEVFDWVNGNISSIDASTLKPFPNLIRINLIGNKLVTLDADLFKNTQNLRWIYFYGNLLEHVGRDLLTGLAKLSIAWFHGNPCSTPITAADKPEQIEDLKAQLEIQCPPLAATLAPPTTTTISTSSESNECPDTCAINEEAQDMKKRIKKLEKEMKKLNLCDDD